MKSDFNDRQSVSWKMKVTTVKMKITLLPMKWTNATDNLFEKLFFSSCKIAMNIVVISLILSLLTTCK